MDHHDTLAAMNYLALLFWRTNNYENAEPLLVGCLERRRALLGATHSDTLSSIFNLALLYLHTQAFGIAKELLVELVDARNAALGPDHAATKEAREYLSKLSVELPDGTLVAFSK